MLVKVPFVFRAEVIPHKCRKSREQYIADTLEVEVKEPGDLVLAAVLNEHSLAGQTEDQSNVYYGDGGFWEEYRLPGASGQSGRILNTASWIELIQDIRRQANPLSGHGIAAHRSAEATYDSLPTVESIQEDNLFRDYVRDDRHEQVQRIEDTLSRYLIDGDQILKQRPEPVYYVQTFGLGQNHGGTALFVGSATMALTVANRRSIFSLAQRDAAVRRAEYVASTRGDTQSLPITPRSNVEMHKPDVFTFDAFSRSALDRGDISLTEFLENKGIPTHALTNLIDSAAQQIADRIKSAPVSEQLEWLSEQSVEPESIMSCFDMA